jgi:hypothetical protein
VAAGLPPDRKSLFAPPPVLSAARVIWLWTRRFHGGPEFQRFIVTVGKVLLVSALGCALCYSIARGMDRLTMLHGLRAPLKNLLVLCGSGVPAVLFICLAFGPMGIADFRTMVRLLLRRRQPPAGKTA